MVIQTMVDPSHVLLVDRRQINSMRFGLKRFKVQEGVTHTGGTFFLIISLSRHEADFYGLGDPSKPHGCLLSENMIADRFSKDGLDTKLFSPYLLPMSDQSGEDSLPPPIS